MMRIVNFPGQKWSKISNNENLNFFQIEDYDWVIAGEWNKNYNVYDFPWYQMGYQRHKTQYFAGFVYTYPEAMRDWIPVFIKPLAEGTVVTYDNENLQIYLSFDEQDMEDYSWHNLKITKDYENQEMIMIVDYDPVNKVATLAHDFNKVWPYPGTKFYICPKKQDYIANMWKRINTAALKGVSKGEITYIWATAQILRQGWEPPRKVHIMEKARNLGNGVLLEEYKIQVPKGKENLLDLSKLKLDREDGSSIIYDSKKQYLKLNNADPSTDLFAYTWIDVEENTDYTLSDEDATQYIYVYSDFLYGTTLAVKETEIRKKIFNTGSLTKILIGFYVAEGSYTGKWTNVSLRRA
ncbi:hypothetical protein SAMN02745912_03466 [Paramaledivibacter caminithermalis DSM 15212]|jgi:hypothetical protein|uniref:Non-contractile tail sheath TIM barrel domain-containing protein n=1 Tax=Paramaledivibacter caminithermalis (strain DSM 15212 / CIP 107654 / DViRD3) TaxID=1121301 RepID=A0A1M6SWR6_PARC5|nr:hypothetical protein [Paramaledivibacter caminithermalis]SHK49133.1 hypothetical protein SAMN02745912_03466 [Paramaledivibacter caminithermalis DSM 15212]